MRYYYNINADNNGYHEVHTETCSFLPDVSNRIYIGNFSTCREAIAEAQRKHSFMDFDGCYFCCNSCHKG